MLTLGLVASKSPPKGDAGEGVVARAIADALTSVVYTDDSKIVTAFQTKVYCAQWEPGRVVIHVRPVAAQTVGDLMELGRIEPQSAEEAFADQLALTV
jgi:hypothetical protein